MNNRLFTPQRRSIKRRRVKKPDLKSRSLIEIGKLNLKSNDFVFTPYKNERDNLGNLLTKDENFNKKRRGRSVTRSRKRPNMSYTRLNRTLDRGGFPDEVLERSKDYFEVDKK